MYPSYEPRLLGYQLSSQIWGMRKIRRHTQTEMYAHIEASKKSNLTLGAYCKTHGIANSTLYHWAKKYENEYADNKPQDTVPGFTPVEVQPEPERNQMQSIGQLHFLFPNGIQVVCPESFDLFC